MDLSVSFDGLGRLTGQTGWLGAEAVSRSFTYDGLSRLKTATGPWEKPLGITSAVTWTYTYDALGNLRTQTTTSGPSAGDSRTWNYTDPVRPHFLTQFIQNNQWNETVTATAFGEPGAITRSPVQDPLLWNAQGKLYQVKGSTYSYDAFDQNTLVATGSGQSATSIVRVGDDFEYDVTAGRATKYFSVDGIRIAVLATSYTAGNASVPPVVQRIVRRVSPLGPPLAAALLALGLASLAAVATRKRAPAWASAPGVGLLAIVLIAMPYEAYAATLPSGGPGTFGRPAEPFLAYITDHLGSVRAVVNQNGMVVETRDYDPFGADIAHVGAFSTQHRFTGQPQDDQGRGLYNYGARFYNPKWGRFVSPDEVTQGFESQGLNPFSYVLNRPTSAIDPGGSDLGFGSFSLGSLSMTSSIAAGVGGSSFGASIGGGVGGGTIAERDQAGQGLGYLLAFALIMGLPEDAPLLAFAAALGLYGGAMIVHASKAKPPQASDQSGDSTERGGSEHTKGARKSTKQKHEQGLARKGRDQGGEKGDARRPYLGANKRAR